MFKEYKDERINELIKDSFELAVRDDEWKLRYLQEWNILFEDIDKMLEYVENDYKGELRVNNNMWYILKDTLVRILALYDLQLIGEEKASENELVVPISKVGNIKEKVFNKMTQYSEEDMKILKRAYIDYKQLERQLNIDIGDTEDIKKVYNYINECVRDTNMTNVDLEVQEYFDFNYKDMCLTISKSNNIRRVCKLSDSIELWNDNKTSYINTIGFEELEKLVLGYEK